MTIGSRLKQAREFRGLSQVALADLLRVTRGACGQWEIGKTTPSTQHLIEISKALGIRFDWLATGNGEMETSPVNSEDLCWDVSDEETRKEQKELLSLYYRLSGNARSALINFLRAV